MNGHKFVKMKNFKNAQSEEKEDFNIGIDLKNVSLKDLVDRLKEMEMRKRDLVVSCDDLYVADGRLYVRNADLDFRDKMIEVGERIDGGNAYELSVGSFGMGTICDKLGISRSFKNELMKKGLPNLFWMNVLAMLRYEGGGRVPKEIREGEGWLYDGLQMESFELAALNEKKRNFLLRTYLDKKGGVSGYLRAMLSDSFNLRLDNFFILKNVLKAVEGFHEEAKTIVSSCYLTETQMDVCFEFPDVRRDMGDLLKNYKDPDTGGGSTEVVCGFRLYNSEVGVRKFGIQDRVIYVACGNGMLGEKRIDRNHIGEKLEEGVIEWSEATEEKYEEFVISKTSDVVTAYIKGDIFEEMVKKIEKVGGIELKARPLDVTRKFCEQDLEMEMNEIDDVCDRFMRGGSHKTALDVVQAVTNFAKHAEADVRFGLEEMVMEKMGNVLKRDKEVFDEMQVDKWA